jgi:hypothetical protein
VRKALLHFLVGAGSPPKMRAGRCPEPAARAKDAPPSAGDDVPSLMRAIRAREQECVRVQGRLAELAATHQVARMDRVRLARDLRHRLTDWQGLILEHPPQARQGLRKLLEGRLAFAVVLDDVVADSVIRPTEHADADDVRVDSIG